MSIKSSSLSVFEVQAFADNYIWLIQDDEKHCVIVDPGDATPVLEVIEKRQLTPVAILLTHHHHDHIGGVAFLKENYPDITVFGPKDDVIKCVDCQLDDGEQINLMDHLFSIIKVAGHTHGHIAYLVDEHLFCGDTLFSGGCGRVFEGTYQQMYDSLQRLASLPDETLVYSAHEYTLSNLDFAITVEPNNQLLQSYRKQVKQWVDQGRPSLPTSIQQEKMINPFLRCQEKAVMQSVQLPDESAISVFSALRQYKDRF